MTMTATINVKTFTATVVATDNSISVTATGANGTRTLTINLPALGDFSTLTSDEQTLLYATMEAEGKGSVEMTFTRPELVMLSNIASKAREVREVRVEAPKVDMTPVTPVVETPVVNQVVQPTSTVKTNGKKVGKI